MLARISKYDFWIPEKILGRSSKKYFFKKYFFETNCFSERHRKIFFETKTFSYEKVNEK